MGLLSTTGAFLTMSGICHSTLMCSVTNDPLLSHLRSAMRLSPPGCSYLLMMLGGYDIRLLLDYYLSVACVGRGVTNAWQAALNESLQ